MEKLRNIAKKNSWIVLTLGMALCVFVLSPSQEFDDGRKDLVETDGEQSTTISELSYEAVPSATQQTVERSSYLIEIIPFLIETNETEVESPNFLPSPSKVFEVISEHIISPNSP